MNHHACGFRMHGSKSISHNLPRPVFLFTLGNTSCCYSSPYLLVLQRACKCCPLFPRHWGNQPWHTRKLWLPPVASPGMVGNLMSIHTPLLHTPQEMSKVPKYRQQTHLSIASESHSEKSANTFGIHKSH